MTADILAVPFRVGNAGFTAHLQSGFYNSHGNRWEVLHCHPDFEVHFLEKGEFGFYAGGETHRVAAPAALILRPFVYHTFYAESQNADRVCLLFDLKKEGEGEAFGEYSALLSPPGDVTVLPGFRSGLSRFRKEREDLRPFEEKELLKNGVSETLIELLSRLRASGGGKALLPPPARKFEKSGTLADIFKYVEDHFAEKDPPGGPEAGLFLSKRQIERLLKTEMSTTFTGLLNRCRIENICKQLDPQTSPGRLARLAGENGFSDYSTFWRNFKKYTGKSPTEYIKTAGGALPGKPPDGTG